MLGCTSSSVTTEDHSVCSQEWNPLGRSCKKNHMVHPEQTQVQHKLPIKKKKIDEMHTLRKNWYPLYTISLLVSDWSYYLLKFAEKLIQLSGVSMKFEVGSWLKENSWLYEQGAVRLINIGGSGGMFPQKILKSGSSEMPFPAFWAPNYHASMSGNYSVCMAIPCEINVKNILQLQS